MPDTSDLHPTKAARVSDEDMGQLKILAAALERENAALTVAQFRQENARLAFERGQVLLQAKYGLGMGEGSGSFDDGGTITRPSGITYGALLAEETSTIAGSDAVERHAYRDGSAS